MPSTQAAMIQAATRIASLMPAKPAGSHEEQLVFSVFEAAAKAAWRRAAQECFNRACDAANGGADLEGVHDRIKDERRTLEELVEMCTPGYAWGCGVVTVATSPNGPAGAPVAKASGSPSAQGAEDPNAPKVLVPTQFGTLGFIDNDSGVEITGFLSSENSLDQYDPCAPEAGSIPERYGFELWHTGSGCTAWRQAFVLDGARVFMLLTDTDGITGKVGPADRLLVGVYLEDDPDEALLIWEQDNSPLDEDNNVPKVWRSAGQEPFAPNPIG